MKIKETQKQINEIREIESFFKSNKIIINKFNNTIDKNQKIQSYNGFLQLSQGGD